MSNTLEKLSQKGQCLAAPPGVPIYVDPALHGADGVTLIPQLVTFWPTNYFTFHGIDQTLGYLVFENTDQSARDLNWFAAYPHSIQWEPRTGTMTDYNAVPE